MQKVHPAVSVNNVFPLNSSQISCKAQGSFAVFFKIPLKTGCQSRTPLRFFQISDKGSRPFKNTRSPFSPTSIFIAYDGHKMSLAFVGWGHEGGGGVALESGA